MILITGATGLVGSHLLLALLREAGTLPIRAITRSLANSAKFAQIATFYPDIASSQLSIIEWVEADMTDEDSIRSAMVGVTQVYHCAAAVTFDPKRAQELMTTNVEGTGLLVNIAIEQQVSKFCFVSSIAAIGGTNSTTARNENRDWDVGRSRSYYSLSKYLSELEVWRGIAEGLPAVIVNPSVIIGPGIRGESSAAFFELAQKGLSRNVPGMTGFVDVRDVAEIMLSLMKVGDWGQRYILNSENMKYRDFFGLVCSSLGVPPPSKELPRYLAEIAWRAEWLRSKLTATPARLTKMNVITSFEQSQYSSEKILKTLNYTFIPMNESISHAAQRFIKNSAD